MPLSPTPRRPEPQRTSSRRAHHRLRPGGRRLTVLLVSLAVAGASLATWGPTPVGTSAAAVTVRPPAESARPVVAGAAQRARATGSATATDIRRAGRDARRDRVRTSGGGGARTGPSTTTGGTGSTAGTPTTGGTSTTGTTPMPGHASVTEVPPVTAPDAAPVTGPDGGPGDVSFYGPNAGAAQAAAVPGIAPADAALLGELARVPTATWLGQWSGDVASTVRGVVADARAAGGVPVFVAYNIPGRDCGGYSAGGVTTAQDYARWVEGIAAGIGTGEAFVVVEPDALAQLCGDPAERYRMLRAAVDVLERNPGTRTYLDAGHADWIDAPTMAERLRAAGVAGADGFALNVSNFGTTAANVAYGRELSGLVGGAHFVVDTSRNGNGPGSDWCNPPGRAVGERPTARTGHDLVDAFLWIKTPGESDGTCNGGPPAGVFWPEYALGLVRGAS